MLDSYKTDSAKDFKQRYHGSFGYYKVPETGRKVLVYIAEINAEGVTFQDKHQTVYKAMPDAGVEFEFIPVTKKLFVHKDELFLVQRRPARMWSRGISAQNTSIYKVTTGGIKTVGFNYIEASLDEDKNTVLQNVKEMENGKRNTCLLSPNFGAQQGQIFVYDDIIGTFLPDRREIRLDETLFRQEITDLVVRHQLPYKVLHG